MKNGEMNMPLADGGKKVNHPMVVERIIPDVLFEFEALGVVRESMKMYKDLVRMGKVRNPMRIGMFYDGVRNRKLKIEIREGKIVMEVVQ